MFLQNPRSEKRDALYKALISARDKFAILEKATNGPRGDYSKWEDICAALKVKESLMSHGIWLSYELERDETGEHWFILKVEHAETGQYDTSKVQYRPGNKAGDEMQCNGSAFTYALKQVTRNFFALAAGGNDDPDSQPIEEVIEEEKVSDVQLGFLREALNQLKNRDAVFKAILSFNRIKVMNELPKSKFSNVMNYINDKGEK